MNNFSYQTIYIVKNNFENTLLSITADYFKMPENIVEKQTLFKNIVNNIEIEPHSYCNRTCWFCPNSFIDRRSKTHFMDRDILLQLIKDLQQINYDKTISFTRYSEPFGNTHFFDSLTLFKNNLPHATLHANTNGDYLTNETLEKAYYSGLKSLNIQLYLNKDDSFSIKSISNMANKLLKRCSNLSAKLIIQKKDWVEYRCTYKDMQINMYARDFKVNGTDRSDIDVLSLKNNRKSPCLKVFTDVYIDYNSSVVPCCNIRSDYNKHSSYLFGKLNKECNSIFNIYFSKAAISWRRHLFTFDEKSFSPCVKCNFSLINENTLFKSYADFIQEEIKKNGS